MYNSIPFFLTNYRIFNCRVPDSIEIMMHRSLVYKGKSIVAVFTLKLGLLLYAFMCAESENVLGFFDFWLFLRYWQIIVNILYSLEGIL